MSAAALGRELGVSQTYIWRRLEGQTAFDLNDLEKIADVLDVPLIQLLPEVVRSGGGAPNVRWADVARPASPTSPEPKPRHITTRPFSPPRRDPSGPVSAIPAVKRRPRDTRPVTRPMPAALLTART
jgi:transcriptional regulator with XRE-family HTH domain